MTVSHTSLESGALTLGASLSLRDRVARSLRASITAGELKAGRVYSVPTLASTFGTSATPVREAMLTLSREQLVEVVRNKGFRVLEVGPAELAQINEVRLLLEPPAIASLAGRLSPPELEGLRAHVDQILEQAQRGNKAGASAAAFVFRDVLLRLCRNDQLVDFIVSLRTRSRAGYPETSIDYSRFAATQYGLIDDLAAANKQKVARTIAYEVSRLGPTLRQVASGS
ncbi:MAG: GntR family transcriptional regulator, partial [Actinomycetota bacterium]|nr:GntR family transcriptional regulator [Actinomycetota bacterium]